MIVPRHFLACLPMCGALLLTGCGYVHFGRLETPATATGSPLLAENSDLRLEKTMLQQELALARKEGQALRAALENRYTDKGTAQADLVARLNETSSELAALRASYARLESDRRRLATSGLAAGTGSAGEAELRAQLGATEEQLAAALRTYTELQDETNRLRREVEQARSENSRLTAEVGTLTARNEQAVAALSQLNSELLAQKDARTRAEQEAAATRAQLQLVIARSDRSAATLAEARAPAAGSTRDLEATLRLEQAPAPETPPTPMLRTSPERLRAATARLAAENGVRYHTVAEGETLESIARRYYGKPERWRVIYAANNSLLRGGRSLAPGMRLEIPPE